MVFFIGSNIPSDIDVSSVDVSNIEDFEQLYKSFQLNTTSNSYDDSLSEECSSIHESKAKCNSPRFLTHWRWAYY
jgi:hypothetical protein